MLDCKSFLSVLVLSENLAFLANNLLNVYRYSKKYIYENLANADLCISRAIFFKFPYL